MMNGKAYFRLEFSKRAI